MWGGMWSKAKEGINEEDYYRECAQERGFSRGGSEWRCTCVMYWSSSPALGAAAMCVSRNGDGLGLP